MATHTDELSEETLEELVDLIDEAIKLVGLDYRCTDAVIDTIDTCVDMHNQDRGEW